MTIAVCQRCRRPGPTNSMHRLDHPVDKVELVCPDCCPHHSCRPLPLPAGVA